MDVDTIHKFLAGSYWATNIPRHVVEKSLQTSYCVGIFFNAEQVAFSRMITDAATVAYLADVFVLPQHRGKGLSKILMQTLKDLPCMQGLRRILLATADAHDLYRQFGFESIAAPRNMMEIWNPDVYKKK
jgi:GNAT superfamily N-acetyltransferase